MIYTDGGCCYNSSVHRNIHSYLVDGVPWKSGWMSGNSCEDWQVVVAQNPTHCTVRTCHACQAVSFSGTPMSKQAKTAESVAAELLDPSDQAVDQAVTFK